MDNKDLFKNWDIYIDPRIDALRRDGYHLESFYLFSNTIEFLLRGSVLLQETWIHNLLIKSNLNFQKTTLAQLDGKTLGDLIKSFSKYSTDRVLILLNSK